MEHELFQSKLKPSVGGTLVSDMIRSSSSGLNLHRVAAIELIVERSIQERRERMFRKGKSSLGPNPTPQPKGRAPNTPTPQVQPPTPATASQPPSGSLPNNATGTVTSLGSTSANHEVSQDSFTLSKPAKEVKAARREEPPADAGTDPSPSEDIVELVCEDCHVKRLRSQLVFGLYCVPCWGRMNCASCETVRVDRVDACTSCHGKFK